MDNYGSHKMDVVLQELKTSCNSEVILIPPKTTSYLQPLDVSVNAPFKCFLMEAWRDWFESRPQEFTPAGYRWKPSYQYIVDFVSEAAGRISKEVIKKSFTCCGIAGNVEEVPTDELNSRLRKVLEAGEREEEIWQLAGRSAMQFLEEEAAEDSDEDVSDIELVENDEEEEEEEDFGERESGESEEEESDIIVDS